MGAVDAGITADGYKVDSNGNILTGEQRCAEEIGATIQNPPAI